MIELSYLLQVCPPKTDFLKMFLNVSYFRESEFIDDNKSPA